MAGMNGTQVQEVQRMIQEALSGASLSENQSITVKGLIETAVTTTITRASLEVTESIRQEKIKMETAQTAFMQLVDEKTKEIQTTIFGIDERLASVSEKIAAELLDMKQKMDVFAISKEQVLTELTEKQDAIQALQVRTGDDARDDR